MVKSFLLSLMMIYSKTTHFNISGQIAMKDEKNKDVVKRRVLVLINYLYSQTDEENQISSDDLVAYLHEQGVPANKKTLKNDLDLMVDAGLDIVTVSSKPNRYFWGSRHFEMPELKLLIDAVSSSRFITEKKSRELTKKLAELASVNQKKELRRHVHAAGGRVKPKNEGIYYIVNDINEAINKHKRIVFRYFEYNGEKERVYRNDGQEYELSPYDLVWNDDFYYVVGFSREHDNVSVFRVDRIDKVEILKDKAVRRPDDYKIEDYSRRIFEMYDGETVKVKLECKNELMKYVIDRFGEDVETKPKGSNRFIAAVEVSLSPTFYAWVFRFAGGMKIMSPKRAVNKMNEMANAILQG